MEESESQDREQVTVNSLKSKMKRTINSKMSDALCANDLLLLMTIIEMLNKLDKNII